VVVENVERNIALGLSPVDAAKRAMSEVTSPIIATALVLCAVFVPTAFISGLTGQFYKQFAITIAISTVISAFSSLTLSPALCAVLLKDHSAPKDGFARFMEKALGWFFRPFNRIFAWAGNKYSAGVGSVLRKSVVALVVYGGLVVLTGWSFNKVPTGFVPTQDKQYLVAFAQLPDAASLDRTEAVIRRMSDIGLKQPGVESAVAFPGLSISGFSVSPNEGIVFFTLKPFEDRKSPKLSGPAIAGALNQQFAGIQDAFILAVPPPPVNGLGTIGGFKLYVTAPISATTLFTKISRASSARAIRLPAWTACSPPSPSTCRNWMRTSTASKPSRKACRCRICSRRCRFISGRFMSTTSIASAAHTKWWPRPTRSFASGPKTSRG
jgi:multidrug efflux pump subunit AcrB